MTTHNKPNMINPSIEMDNCNTNIKIQSGSFIIKNSKIEFKLTGQFYFKWSPTLGTYFKAESNLISNKLFNLHNSEEKLSLIIDDIEIGNCIITEITENLGNSNKTEIEGRIIEKVVFGDKSIMVNKIKFSIPNLREFNGEATISISEKTKSFSNSRLTFENEEFIVIIDKRKDYQQQYKKLKNEGGFLIQYDGILENKNNKPLNYEDTREILNSFSTFISFLNGRKTSTIFIEGIYEDNSIWRDFTNYNVDIFNPHLSWPSKSSIKGISNLWNNFYILWKNDKDFIRRAIHWYLQCNGNSGYVEGSIIMAQTALELIYNWWVIESKKIILGKDSENISASNKIRLLISQFNIATKIPKELENLSTYFKQENSLADGPETIVQIRNAIVHSQMEKRNKLSQIAPLVRYESLQLCIWYIELSLLNILEFKGTYFNRAFNIEEDISV